MLVVMRMVIEMANTTVIIFYCHCYYHYYDYQYQDVPSTVFNTVTKKALSFLALEDSPMLSTHLIAGPSLL